MPGILEKEICEAVIPVLSRMDVVQDPNFEIDVRHWNLAPVERLKTSSRL